MLPINSTENLYKLEDLICGTPIENDTYIDADYTGLIERLRSDLCELHPQLKISAKENIILPASAIFPFLARKFLELALTSMLARVDPLRVIAARKNQLDASYEPGRQNKSSISWAGDIMPKGTSPGANPWISSTLEKGLERSILGWHIGEVAISPGLRKLADEDNTDSVWLRELSQKDKPLDWIKGRLSSIYSMLSKGVHSEYLVDDKTSFDGQSIKQHMQDCYMLIGILAAATHVSPLFSRSIPIDAALLMLKKLENEITQERQ